MNPIVRFTLMMLMCFGTSAIVAGCKWPTGPEIADAISPPPEKRWYDGAAFYRGSDALEVRIHPDYTDPEHRDYANWVLLDATPSGQFSSASYYLHARKYKFEFRNANTKAHVRTVTVTPNNIENERVYEYLSQLDWLYNFNSGNVAP